MGGFRDGVGSQRGTHNVLVLTGRGYADCEPVVMWDLGCGGVIGFCRVFSSYPLLGNDVKCLLLL